MNIQSTTGGGVFASTVSSPGHGDRKSNDRLRMSVRQAMKRAVAIEFSNSQEYSSMAKRSCQSRPKRAGGKKECHSVHRRIEHKTRRLRSSTITKRQATARKSSSGLATTTTETNGDSDEDCCSGHGKISFPVRLFDMLTDVQERGLSSIVSWQPHGRAIRVHNPNRFVAEILPHYFRQTKITSFQRQLNVYGFRRIVYGADAGSYHHSLFLRGVRKLSFLMSRVGVKNTGIRSTYLFEEEEPDFSAMPPIDESLGKKKSLSKDDLTAATIQVERPLVERLVDMQLDVITDDTATLPCRNSDSPPRVDGCDYGSTPPSRTETAHTCHHYPASDCGCQMLHTEGDRIDIFGRSFYYMNSQACIDETENTTAAAV